MEKIEAQIKRLEGDLTNLFQRVIVDKGLVDTGKLYRSISFKMVSVNGKLSFNMSAADYYEFLDEKYGITSTALASNEFLKIEEKIATIYAQLLVDSMDDTKTITL